MIRKEGDGLDYYWCETADWNSVVLAVDENEAASKSLILALDDLDDGAMVSPVMRVKKIKTDVELSDFLIKMDSVLADIGKHKEAKALKEICNL